MAEPANPFSLEALQDLSNTLDSIKEDKSISAVIFTGKEKFFSAGANIEKMSKMTSSDAKEFSKAGQEAFDKIANLPLITIAAINGIALGGGCEITLACDFRIAAERAKMGQPEINLGLIPGWGGTRRLAAIVGKSTALELMVTGRVITADEALRINLVNKVVSGDQLLDECINLAKSMASKSQKVVSFIKESFNAGNNLSDAEAELVERELFSKCFDLADSKEGIQAFLEKRSPQWTCQR
jgi:enoyl-CoA hydratase